MGLPSIAFLTGHARFNKCDEVWDLVKYCLTGLAHLINPMKCGISKAEITDHPHLVIAIKCVN